MKRLIVLASLIMIVIPHASLKAQITGPIIINYHLTPGQTYKYRLVSTSDAIDPTGRAKFTTEYTDTTELIVHVDSVMKDNASLTATRSKFVHIDRSKSAGENGIKLSHDPMDLKAQIVLNPYGIAIDSSEIEADSGVRVERMRFSPSDIAQRKASGLRKMHHWVFPAIMKDGMFSKSDWQDTDRRIVTTYSFNSDKGAASASNGIQNNGQTGMVTARNYHLEEGVGRHNEKTYVLTVKESRRIGSRPAAITTTTYVYRASDGVPLSIDTKMNRPAESADYLDYVFEDHYTLVD